MIDEGYIKFHLHWEEDPQPVVAADDEIIQYRDRMFVLNMIGHDTVHDVGFGNISHRTENTQFVVSGTQTGHHEKATPAHFSWVTQYHIANNSVHCKGPVKASSESLTHAAIYELDARIKAVIHVHHNAMWEHYKDLLPTTKDSVPYGTPEMAREIFRLWRGPALPQQKILVMGGHYGGLISFDTNFAEAAERLEFYLERLP